LQIGNHQDNYNYHQEHDEKELNRSFSVFIPLHTKFYFNPESQLVQDLNVNSKSFNKKYSTLYCIVLYLFYTFDPRVGQLNPIKRTSMKLENTKAQMRKGILEYCILTILSNKEAYPSEIIAELKSAKLIVVEGTLYPLLTRLKNAELLQYNWVESKSGPPRKYYFLTPSGVDFLKELKTTWTELSAAVKTISKTHHNE